MVKCDYYEVLGVIWGVLVEEIKKVYCIKVKELYLDCNKDCKVLEVVFKDVNEVYDCLKDDQKKVVYDCFGYGVFDGLGGFGGGFGCGGQVNGDFGFVFVDVFEDFFGDMMGCCQGGGGGWLCVSCGQDLCYNLCVLLEDVFGGVQKVIIVFGLVICGVCDGIGVEGLVEFVICLICLGMGKVWVSQGFFIVECICLICNGQGQIIKNFCKECYGVGWIEKECILLVNILVGVEIGICICFVGEGEVGMCGGFVGDLYIFIEVQDYVIFLCDGKMLVCQVLVSMVIVVFGGEIEVLIIDGGCLCVKILLGM